MQPWKSAFLSLTAVLVSHALLELPTNILSKIDLLETAGSFENHATTSDLPSMAPCHGCTLDG